MLDCFKRRYRFSGSLPQALISLKDREMTGTKTPLKIAPSNSNRPAPVVASIHRQELFADWDRAQIRQDLLKIDPL